MCHSAPTCPLNTAMSAIKMRPRMTAIMTCHTDMPMATSEEPIWKLLSPIIHIDHQPRYVNVVHRRREGGSGRMSSLIHRLLSTPGTDGKRMAAHIDSATFSISRNRIFVDSLLPES